MNTHKTP